MAELTYEIAYWQASDALKKDIKVCQPVVDVVKRHTPHSYVYQAQTSL